MKERIVATCEKEFLLDALQQGFMERDEPFRLDGRKSSEYRKIKVVCGTQWGHVTASIGETRVVCSVSCEVASPTESRPNDGFVRFRVSLSPMASADYEAFGRQTEDEVYLTRLLEHVFKESKAVGTDSLCIAAGEKVWAVSVDVTVVNDAGNLSDACTLATLAGLLYFRRPHVSMEGGTIVIHSVDEHPPVSLAINHKPVNITTALFDNMVVLVDPSKLETSCCNGAVLVAMNAHQEICSINTSGCAVSAEQMEALIDAAKPHAAHMIHIIDTELEKAIARKAPPKEEEEEKRT